MGVKIKKAIVAFNPLYWRFSTVIMFAAATTFVNLAIANEKIDSTDADLA